MKATATLRINKCTSCPYYSSKMEARSAGTGFNHDELVDVHYCVDREMETSSRGETTRLFEEIHEDCFIVKGDYDT